MAEKFLEPQNPLKKIDTETGDINYIYPQTTAKQVIMDDDGTRLNTILNENILYLGDTGDGGTEVINADTWSGHTPTTFLSLVYPVGAIYMSINATSPETLFGFGTWERIKDTFLLSAGDTYNAGSTGGSAKHTLTINEMPSHGHLVYVWDAAGTTGNAYYYNGATKTTHSGARIYNATSSTWVASGSEALVAGSGRGDPSGGTNLIGSGSAHNNMPPYLAVYMWKRTA